MHKAIYFYNKKKSGKIFEVNDLKKKIIFDVKDVWLSIVDCKSIQFQYE